jgi:hypothetical protein
MPRWAVLLVVGLVAALVFVRGPARRVDAIGTQLLEPLQFGV